MPAPIHRSAVLHRYGNRLPPGLGDADPGGVQRCIDGIWTTADLDSSA
ncbi:hypothetical protein V1318_18855 [Lysobacter sp. CCNWLW3]